MQQAVEADKESRRNKQPALQKLRVLPQVKQFVLNRQLQEELLDQDILRQFKAWLEVREVAQEHMARCCCFC